MDEENCPAVEQPNNESQDALSILSELSEDEDVPSSDTLTLKNVLQKAMNQMEASAK